MAKFTSQELKVQYSDYHLYLQFKVRMLIQQGYLKEDWVNGSLHFYYQLLSLPSELGEEE